VKDRAYHFAFQTGRSYDELVRQLLYRCVKKGTAENRHPLFVQQIAVTAVEFVNAPYTYIRLDSVFLSFSDVLAHLSFQLLLQRPRVVGQLAYSDGTIIVPAGLVAPTLSGIADDQACRIGCARNVFCAFKECAGCLLVFCAHASWWRCDRSAYEPAGDLEQRQYAYDLASIAGDEIPGRIPVTFLHHGAPSAELKRMPITGVEHIFVPLSNVFSRQLGHIHFLSS
jgi:hypothetical protein